MSTSALRDAPSLRAPIVVSAVLHLVAAAMFLAARSAPRHGPLPAYRVNLIAAPPGERRVGVVQPPTPTPAPVARTTPDIAPAKAPAKVPATRAPKRAATPNVVAPGSAPKAAPVAGGGPVGGKGADVANVKIDGPAFPYQGYLDNIVRQIAVNFRPAARGALQAEVAFLIRRDGTVLGVRLTKRSSVYSFDQDALAAIELASRHFGPLPSGFADDVLPVIFSFDPRLLR